MIVEHVLTDVDSLQSLALKYLGDATHGEEIANYNRLSYPYIVKSKEDLHDFFGSGYITIVRANYQTAVVIKKGWTFKTRPSLLTRNTTRIFEVSEDTVIPAGVQKYSIPLRCTVPSSFGNVMEDTITEVGDNTAQLSGIQFLSIRNESKFSGGRPLDVLTVGDAIYIPTESSEVAPEDATVMLNIMSGEDIVLDVSGNLIIENGGDLASSYGYDNIKYAVTARLKTEFGDLLHHPEYGTNFQELIGKPNLANRENLMEIAIYRSLVQETRITEVSVDSLVVEGTSIFLDVSYKVAINGLRDRVTLAL